MSRSGKSGSLLYETHFQIY